MSISYYSKRKTDGERLAFVVFSDEESSQKSIDLSISYIKIFFYSFIKDDVNKIFYFDQNNPLPDDINKYHEIIYIRNGFLIQEESVIVDLLQDYFRLNGKACGYYLNNKPQLLVESNTNSLDYESFTARINSCEQVPGYDLSKSEVIDSENYDILKSRVTSHLDGVFLAPFLFNNEGYHHQFCIDDESDITLFTLAAGFKGNYLVDELKHRVTKIYYIDINQYSLDLREKMVREWDGKNLPLWFEEHDIYNTFYTTEKSKSDVEKLWKNEIQLWSGEDNFTNNWKSLAAIDTEYIQLDLIKEVEKFTKLIDRLNTNILWLSNVWENEYVFYELGGQGRKETYIQWCNQLKEADPNLFLYQSEIFFPEKMFYRTNCTIDEICRDLKDYS